MAIRIEHVGDVAIVIARGTFLRDADVHELRASLTRLIDEDHLKILVNLSRTRFMNSIAIGVLVGAASRVSKSGGRLVLCGMEKRMQDVFSLLTLTRLPFAIDDSCDEALKALQEV